MTKYLYLYEDPFVVEDKQTNNLLYLSQTTRIDDKEREDEELIRSLIVKFMIDHKLIIAKETEYIKNPGNNTASIAWLIHWKNLRSLVVQKEFDDLLIVMEAGDDEFVTQLIDLHAFLGMRVDHILLNTIITRVMRSIQIIPYPVQDTETSLSWEEIHTSVPYLWILIMFQSVIKSETKV